MLVEAEKLGDVVRIPHVPVVCDYPSHPGNTAAFCVETCELITWLLEVAWNHSYPEAGIVLVSARLVPSPGNSRRGMLVLSDCSNTPWSGGTVSYGYFGRYT